MLCRHVTHGSQNLEAASKACFVFSVKNKYLSSLFIKKSGEGLDSEILNHDSLCDGSRRGPLCASSPWSRQLHPGVIMFLLCWKKKKCVFCKIWILSRLLTVQWFLATSKKWYNQRDALRAQRCRVLQSLLGHSSVSSASQARSSPPSGAVSACAETALSNQGASSESFPWSCSDRCIPGIWRKAQRRTRRTPGR